MALYRAPHAARFGGAGIAGWLTVLLLLAAIVSGALLTILRQTPPALAGLHRAATLLSCVGAAATLFLVSH